MYFSLPLVYLAGRRAYLSLEECILGDAVTPSDCRQYAVSRVAGCDNARQLRATEREN